MRGTVAGEDMSPVTVAATLPFAHTAVGTLPVRLSGNPEYYCGQSMSHV